ncbi:MAG: YeeE/YedE family protein [Gammaproteobacteria bacterium]|nr:MAG: YeeE/YedE family protein [Gammaproteobacteria bacterium]
MENFTPLSAFIGGSLIGLSAALLLLLKGRIAGITGIMDSMVPPYERASFWRGAFIIGLILGVLLYALLFGSPTITVEASDSMLIIAGLLVGFGSNLGSGCTSGHGICGIALFSTRSIIATLTFMASGFLTVFITHHLLG